MQIPFLASCFTTRDQLEKQHARDEHPFLATHQVFGYYNIYSMHQSKGTREEFPFWKTLMNRLAIYYTPDSNSPLGRTGAEWLGIHLGSETGIPSPEIPWIHTDRVLEILKRPCHYGFHGTIHPPFRPREGVDIEMVADRLDHFARQQEPFLLPPLRVKNMSGFFCLKPEEPCHKLQQLAADTVRLFDAFRELPSQSELERRKRNNLSRNQERLLARWGYPYVMEEFRFHLTLTDTIVSSTEKEQLSTYLKALFTPELCSHVLFNSLSLFLEQDGKPFMLLKTFPFGSP